MHRGREKDKEVLVNFAWVSRPLMGAKDEDNRPDRPPARCR